MYLKRLPFIGLALIVAACGDKPDVSDLKASELEASIADGISARATDGRLVVSSLPKVSEPNACILPITITNGTAVEASISMMQFTLSGSGADDSGNMFTQVVAPGDTNTARLLFPTRKCEELTVITVPNLTCETGGTDCSDTLEFETVDGLLIQRG